MTRAAGISTHFEKLLYTPIAGFCQDEESEWIGRELLKNDVYMEKLRSHCGSLKHKPFLYLQNYPIYADRLQVVLHSMKDWRPQTLRQIIVKPYRNLLNYYAFWFAICFG